MSTFVALFDACVLYPAPLRDLLLWLSMSDLFRPHWTDDIHSEWIRNVSADRPDIPPEALERTRQLLNDAVPDCLVRDYHGLMGSLELPDPDDRHVLAAAIRAGAGVIVTFNLKDFPNRILEPLGLEAQHPDDFVVNLLDLNPAAVLKAVQQQRASLRHPPQSIDQLLETYQRLGLAQTVARLKPFADLL